MDIRQIYLRQELWKETGLRTMLVIYEKWSNRFLYNWLDVLEVGQKVNAPFGEIRIYPITNFMEL